MKAMSEVDNYSAEENIRNEPQKGAQQLRQLFAGAWMTQAFSVAAELGIADLLNSGPHSHCRRRFLDFNSR